MELKQKYELYKLDFSKVKGNRQVQAQGVLVCIKTGSKGFFSLELERFPTRQDLAKKTLVGNIDVLTVKAEKKKGDKQKARY